MTGSRVSVVIVSRDEGSYLRSTVSALLRDLPYDGQLVVVDDASSDESADGLGDLDPRVLVHHCAVRVGAPAARNLGARLAGGDVLLFSDAHVEPLGPWVGAVLDALARPRVGAVCASLVGWEGGEPVYGLRFVDVGTNVEWLPLKGIRPYPVPLLAGFFIAVLRRTFVLAGGFDPGMVGWGLEDCELSMRLWALGWDCLVVPSLHVRHLSKDGAPPAHYFEWDNALHNILRLGLVHYGTPRLEQLWSFYAHDPHFELARSRVKQSDALRQRRAMHAVRVRDDDEFFTFCGVG